MNGTPDSYVSYMERNLDKLYAHYVFYTPLTKNVKISLFFIIPPPPSHNLDSKKIIYMHIIIHIRHCNQGYSKDWLAVMLWLVPWCPGAGSWRPRG